MSEFSSIFIADRKWVLLFDVDTKLPKSSRQSVFVDFLQVSMPKKLVKVKARLSNGVAQPKDALLIR